MICEGWIEKLLISVNIFMIFLKTQKNHLITFS